METPNEVSVEYSLRLSDVYTPLQWSWPNLRRWVLVLIIWCAVNDLCLSQTSYFRSFPEGAPLGSYVILAAILATVWLVVYPFYQVWSLFRSTPAFRRPRSVTFSANGIHFESEDGRGDWKWSAFARIIETRGNFVFAQSSRSATYVPKRHFHTPDEIQALRKLIVEHHKGKWRLRRD